MARLRYLALFLAFLLLGTLSAFAQSESAGQESQPAGTISISGHLDLDGKPAAGVTVVVLGVYDPTHPDDRQGVIKKTTSDQQGNYKFVELPARTYRVLPLDQSLVLTADEQRRPGPLGKSLLVGDTKTFEGIDFSLVHAANISGSVTTLDGKPVAGAWVQLSFSEHGGPIFDPITGGWRGYEKTDENGTFRINGVLPASYYLYVGHYGPPSNPNGAAYYPGVTDPKMAAIISLAPGEEFAQANISVPDPGEVFEAVGQIFDESGKPMPNAKYCFKPELGGSGRYGEADATGKFRIEGLPPGKYAVAVMPQAQTGLSSDYLSFSVVSANVGGLRLQAHPGAVIKGVAVIEGTDGPQKLSDLPDIVASSQDFRAFYSENVSVAPDGSFSIPGLKQGTWLISAPPRGVDDFAIVRILRSGGPQNPELTISKDREEISGLRIIFARGSGVIRGQVVAADGGPLPDGASVEVTAKLTSGPSPVLSKSTSADALGYFEIFGVVDGDYALSTFCISKFVGLNGQTQTVTVAHGEMLDITLTAEINRD